MELPVKGFSQKMPDISRTELVEDYLNSNFVSWPGMTNSAAYSQISSMTSKIVSSCVLTSFWSCNHPALPSCSSYSDGSHSMSSRVSIQLVIQPKAMKGSWAWGLWFHRVSFLGLYEWHAKYNTSSQMCRPNHRSCRGALSYTITKVEEQHFPVELHTAKSPKGAPWEKLTPLIITRRNDRVSYWRIGLVVLA